MKPAAARRIRDFEVYLLNRMRGARARDVLARRGVDAAAVAAELVQLGLEEPGCRIELYEALLGPPGRRSPSARIQPDSYLAGSTAWQWRLPTWPRTPFVVNAHPKGWAWVTGFVRPGGESVPPPRLSELEPWESLRGEVAAAIPTTLLDGWDQQIDLRADAPNGRAHRLRFDYELLQDVQQLDQLEPAR